MKTVLVADDEKNIRSSLSVAFRLEGYEVRTAADGQEALEVLDRGGIDLAVVDLQMPRRDGFDVLRELRERGLDTPVMILTAHGSIEKAVEATRLGAFDFIEKPPHTEKILVSARNALRQALLEEENRELREETSVSDEMVGSSEPMKRLHEQILRVAPSQARVLILGENGTGKELIARALHHRSGRSEGPYVRVNCAAIPRDLFESELFGHERGAFTGATTRRRGKFARADGGTIFLDEIGEIPTELQPKILRVIESGEIEPVGSDDERTVDVRVIAATNRDLERAVEEGRFREDLYYRLKVVILEAPPLRARMDDLPALAEHFLKLACVENAIPGKSLAPEGLELLKAHAWPGNVRELANLIERLVILTPGDPIGAVEVREALPDPRRSVGGKPDGPRPLRDTMTDLEREVVLAALERNRWRMAATARELDLERSHLYKKLKALGIEKPE